MRALLLCLIASGCVFSERANPRIERLQSDGDASDYTSFRYDDAGHLVRATGKVGGTRSSVKLEWDGDLLVSFTRALPEVDSDDVTTTLWHDADGRVVGARREHIQWTFRWRELGQLELLDLVIVRNELGDDDVIRTERSFEYDAQGDIRGIEETEVTTVHDGRTKTQRRFEVKEGHVTEVVINDGDIAWVQDVDHVDGRLDGIATTQRTSNGGEDVGELRVTYDDRGLIDSLVEKAERDEVKLLVKYGDGEARGLAMAPSVLVDFWDMRGQGYPRTGPLVAARMLGLDW